MVLHVNHKLMPPSQTWSYMKSHIRILCHDGAFERHNSINSSS
ncbi:hypothetical protein F383_29320 [Gossypium arboreum]|uniref:Uncharacterized protein n=1 Tax=Gossypium arboreum TaxID=29729 RepID=A0A0B0PF33_GOSAR|nr:hypothetical protein F383_27986 [Gossypium arboreum]KHG23542.1 hypothetical protein F383_29320 [Gossypium arboreum]